MRLYHILLNIFQFIIPQHLPLKVIDLSSICIKMGCEESSILKTLPDQAKDGSLRKSTIRKTRTQTNLMCGLQESSYNLTEQDNSLIQTTLLKHSLLFKAKGYANREIISLLESFRAKAGQIIFKKGDPSDYFYLILKGSVQITNWIDGQGKKTIGRGSYFGDLGIYNKTTRSANAICLQECELVGLQSQYFLKLSLELSKKSQKDVFNFIKNVTIFKNLTPNQKHRLSYLAQQLKFKKGTVIFTKGQVASCLYVIKHGSVELTVPGKEPIQIKIKQSFGQGCLIGKNSERLADAVCLQNTTLLSFSSIDIEKYLGRQRFALQVVNKLVWAFKHNNNIKILQPVLEHIIQIRELTYYANNDIIAEKGQPITHLVISLEGGINDGVQLEVLNTEYVMNFRHQTKQLRKTGKGGDVAFISIQSLQNKFHHKFQSLVCLSQHQWKEIQAINIIQNYTTSLNFSELSVVQNKGNHNIGCTLKIKTQREMYFAMKIFDKAKILQENDQNAVMNMREVGTSLYHNLIAKHYRVLSDQYRLYFIGKWIQGEDLFDFVAQNRILPVNLVKHFAACILSIMQYLHHRRILWRQLKLQSFVIDSHGYLNLVDLMYLQELPEEQSSLNNTQKATFYYIAPEILCNQGYGFQTDFWALGVLVYRMVVGQFPYGTTIQMRGDNLFDELLQQIINKPLFLPNSLPQDLQQLLKMLLSPNPLQRGFITFSKLRSLAFFKDYDWRGLAQKKVNNIPYIPKKIARKESILIKFIQWLQHQQSQLPAASILDDLQTEHKATKK